MGRYENARGLVRTRRFGVGVALAVAAAVGLPATAASAASPTITNPGFESGTTAGWSGGGAWVTSEYGGRTAPDGRYFAVVEGGCYTNVLLQSFNATRGQTLAGWSFFQANDYLPYNDSGAVQLLVSGGGVSATVFSSSIGQVGSFGGTGWRPWTYTFPADGSYTIRVLSSNGGDCAAASVVGLDLAAADTTPPQIAASATSGGAPYTSGTWTNQDVTVHFSCTDDASGVASLTPDRTLGEGDGQSVTGTCTDAAGNSASATFSGVRVDRTAPEVTWSGNAGSYTVDQQVAIGCTAADALSGVASSTCADVTGAAYSFGLGTHTYSASATDNAGNRADAATSFTVTVDHESLCTLTTRFSSSKGVATALCAKLDAASAAAARGQVKTAQNILGAYANQVAAQSGKALTAEQAGILTGLAGTL